MGWNGEEEAYDRVMVGKSIVNGQVFEEPADMVIKEPFDLRIVEFRVYEDGTEVRFDDIRETLWRGLVSSMTSGVGRR